jgi:hypothetical protein
MEPERLFALVFVLGMFAGVFVLFQAMRHRAEYLQMQHRERMAMIERGQVPLDPPRPPGAPLVTQTAGMRSITLGIIVIAVGLGMMSIISIAAATPSVGVGIGGAIVIVGVAFITSGMVRRSNAGSWPGPPDRRDL